MTPSPGRPSERARPTGRAAASVGAVSAAVGLALLLTTSGSPVAADDTAPVCPVVATAPDPSATPGPACSTPAPAVPAPVVPAPPSGPPAPTDPNAPTAADARIAATLAVRAKSLGLGLRTSVLVRDVTSGRDIAGVRSATALMPASTAKLVTAVTALQALGADHHFLTSTLATPRRDVIVLVGGGDPSLTSANLDTLAAATALDLTSRRVASVQLQVDDTLFPTPTTANGWPVGTVPSQVSAVRALVVDQHRSVDTSLDAGRVFAVKLALHGVRVVRVVRHARQPDARQLAGVEGASLDEIVREMLLTSDNDIAEVLARQVAVAAGVRPTWQATAAVRNAALTRLGVPMAGVHVYDGSGLSRRDRMTPGALVTLLQLAADSSRSELHSMVYGGDLPLAGVSGSLRTARGRFSTAPSRCATGILWAKTGQLHDVTSLAGIAYGADGRLKAFAILVNGPHSSLAMRRKVDALAATVTGCW